MYVWLWLWAVFFTGAVHSQTFFEAYQNIDPATEAQRMDQLTDSLLNRSQEASLFEEAIQIAHKHSILKNRKRDYQGAVAYGLLEIGIFEKLGIVDDAYIQALYNVGRFYYKDGDFIPALKMHQKIVDLNYSSLVTGRSYCEMGRSLFSMGDYYEAVNYYRFGITALEKADSPRTTLRSLIQLSNIYEQINTPETLAQKYEVLNRALEISKEIPLSRRDSYALYNSWASYYNNDETFDFDLARLYMDKALKMAITAEDYRSAAIFYSNLGNLYNFAKKDSALYYFEKALEYYDNDVGIVRTYNNLAYFHISKEDYPKALTAAHETLTRLGEVGKEPDRIPKTSELIEVSDKYSVLRAFLLKATAYLGLYHETGELSWVKKAFENLNVAEEIIEFLLAESTEEKSKFHWRETASAIYTKLIKCAHIMNKEDLVFLYGEKNKAFLLTAGILENAKMEQLPDSLRSLDFKFRKKMVALQENFLNTEKTAQHDSIQALLFSTRKEYKEFQKSLHHQFPSHFLASSKGEVMELHDVQKTLKKDEVLVSFTWNETDEFSSTAFGMVITGSTLSAYPIDVKLLKKLTEQYRELISKPFNKKEEKVAFLETSHQLYLILFPTQQVRDLLNKKHLAIIPDAALQSIPFEALIINKEEETYLLQQSEISYAYSASFQLHNDIVNRNASKDFIGFSPVVFPTTTRDSLPNTQRELELISQGLKSDLFIRNEATKKAFVENSGDYRIIHLATHANATGNPWIAFRDSLVSLPELYTMPNHAELVVLSACNTSMGEITEGEGTLSLARGFFYSGAHSVVSSLWNVNDKSSTELLQKFYMGLEKGMSKSEALRSAKLDYLNSHSLSETSPYYWASFIVVGNTDSISYGNHPIWITLLLILGLVALTLWVFRKKIKK